MTGAGSERFEPDTPRSPLPTGFYFEVGEEASPTPYGCIVAAQRGGSGSAAVNVNVDIVARIDWASFPSPLPQPILIGRYSNVLHCANAIVFALIACACDLSRVGKHLVIMYLPRVIGQ